MTMVMNESEKAKNELMHFGVRGMRWGIRKADTRLGLHVGASKLSMAPGAKAVRKAHETKINKANDRYDKFIRASEDRLTNYRGQLRTKVREIQAGPGNRFSKAFKAIEADHQLAKKYWKAENKAEDKWFNHETDRNRRVKAKQDALSNSLKAQMEAEISAVMKSGNPINMIFKPAQIEMKYTKQLVEGMAKIDEEED